MANEQLIDQVVDPAVKKQIEDTTAQLVTLDAQLVQVTKDANLCNTALLQNSTTYDKLTKAATAAALANEKIAQAQNKTAITAAQLEKAEKAKEAQIIRTQQAQDRATASQERAAAAAQKALSPYQQLSKELDKMRASAKDVGVQFGENSEEFKNAAKPVQELDARLKGIDKTLGQSQRNVGNYGEAFRNAIANMIPFGGQANNAINSISAVSKEAEGATGILGELGAGFVAVTTASFVIAIASATYYLSQFQSTGNKVNEFLAGLKGGFAELGAQVLLQDSGGLIKDYQKGKQAANVQATQIDLQNYQQVKQQDNNALKAKSAYFLALTSDRTIDIEKRQQYFEEVKKINQQILNNELSTAAKTIKVALDLGFQSSTLTDKQIAEQKKKLIAAAGQGNLKPGQSLALDGDKFTDAGFQLYKQGVAQFTAYQEATAAEITRINSDKDNQELRADKALAAAQNALDKANVESALTSAKLILDSNTATNAAKLKANNDYVTESIKLLKVEEENQLAAAGLSGKGGADSRAQKINRAAIEQTTQNDINKVIAEGQKTRQELIKTGNEAELRLYRAKIQGIQDTEKSIIDNAQASYQTRMKANEDFVNDSLKLLAKEKSAALKSARPEDRAAVLQEYENKKAVILRAGQKQTEQIEKETSDLLKQGLEDLLKYEQASADNAVTILQDGNIKQLQALSDARDKEAALLQAKYTNGKLDRKEYNDQLLAIDDQYNIDRLGQIAFYEQSVLEIRQAKETNDLNFAKGNGATPEQLAEIKSKSGVREQTQVVAKAGQDLSNAVTKKGGDDAQTTVDKSAADRADASEAIQDVQKLQEDGSKLLQAEYQHEIDLLEQKKTLIEQNANAEITAVNNSILSERSKQDKINVINAQTAAQEAAITAQQNKIKNKEAKENRIAAVAGIIENTALGELKAIGQGGIFGLPFTAIIAALGAVELASVLATPLPTFALGTTSHPGGWGVWGEAGIEAAIEPSGKSYLSPDGATLANMPKGTQIVPHMQLMQYLKPDAVVIPAGADEVGWKDLLSQLKKMEPKPQKRPKIQVNVFPDNPAYLRK